MENIELYLTMKKTFKLISIGFCTFSLSGCAFTHDALQAIYDNEADKNCASASCDHIQAKFDREQRKYKQKQAKANARKAKAKKAAEKYISNLNAVEALRGTEVVGE